MRTKLLIDQHIHGAYGVDFNKAAAEDILYLSKELLQNGIGGYFPTLVTDNIMNIKHQIEVIKKQLQLKLLIWQKFWAFI